MTAQTHEDYDDAPRRIAEEEENKKADDEWDQLECDPARYGEEEVQPREEEEEAPDSFPLPSFHCSNQAFDSQGFCSDCL